jgi:ABC-type polysaccharide/polyol phosphate transport system ATPase subunit
VTQPIIEVTGLEKSFRIPAVRRDTIREHALAFFWPRRFQQLRVLRSITFSVGRGESFGIMGRNGSGKSTLLKILAGIYRPDAGRVAVQAAVTPILQLGLGWNQELTARDNLMLTGTAMGLTLQELHQQFDEIVAFAELERFVDLQLKFYSSGMSARLAYAIAFRAVREVLLLDEVFAVGDGAFVSKCQDRYAELQAAGHTLLLVSHDPNTISRFCSRAVLLDGGRVVAAGKASEVAEEYERVVGSGRSEPAP